MAPHRQPTAHTLQLFLSSDQALARMSSAQAHEFRADWSTVQETIRSGVTSKRANKLDAYWVIWDDFGMQRGLDPFLRNFEDQLPVLQIFGQQYRDGRLAPSGRTVGSRTVEDAIRAVGQVYSRMGTKDPRRDTTGKIDFRLQRQLRAYKKLDAPPARVKPIPITIIIYILQVAYNSPTSDEARAAVADMICIAFYYLLRPGEYTGTTSDDGAFNIEDVTLHLGDRRLNLLTCKDFEIEAATSASYTFTTQKNGKRNDVISHARSGDNLCCPVKATIRRILYHRKHNTSHDKPLASYYRKKRLITIKAKDITDALRTATTCNEHITGISSSEISARSLRAGGAMALLCGRVDANLIMMLGRWHSDAMMRYLHQQAQPIMKQFAVAMFANGTYTFLPDESVPIADTTDLK